MAYVTYYKIIFDNVLWERTEFLIQKKDGDPLTVVQEYAGTNISWRANSSNDGKLSHILSREAILKFDIRPTDTDYWNEMVDGDYDTWKVIGTNDTQNIFHGFVIPDENAVPFQDKPFDATIIAQDCLGLLKQEPLTNIDGTAFEGEYSIIRYIAACLKKTKLDLPIRVYDNFFHSTFLTRSTDLKHDFVSQAYLDYRTFQKDAVTFYNCYDTLDKILSGSFKLFYHAGEWNIIRLGLYQFNATQMFYTVYDADISIAVGFEEVGTYGSVGKNEIIYAIEEDQIKTTKFAYRNVKSVYNYAPWPELPKNNKFERGSIILSGSSYRSLTIDDWEYGIARVGTTPPSFPFNLTATSNSRAYSKRTYDAFGNEMTRELIMTKEPGANTQTWLRSSPIPVTINDRISISQQEKIEPNFISRGSGAAFTDGAIVYVTDGANYWGLKNNNADRIANWKQNSLGFLVVDYIDTSAQLMSMNVESPPIPVNGNLFIVFPFDSASLSGGSQAVRTGIDIRYYPYTAGGYLEVKGDSWTRTQIKTYPDSFEHEIFLSDTPKKLLKGCLLRSNGTPCSPTWFRYGVAESRHYKELINIAVFNHFWRRFWQIEGSFSGTKFSPANDTTNLQPLGFHKIYKFVDITPEERFFMLLAPVEQDMINAKFTGVFAETNMVPSGAVPTVESMTSLLNRIVAAINGTAANTWATPPGAPHGTPYFPPHAGVSTFNPNEIVISLGAAYTMTASVDINGAGNSPSITETYNNVVSPTGRLIVFQLGTDIAEDNIFTFSAYGHDVDITVQASTLSTSQDGNQLGDSSSFNYIF